MLVQTSSGRVLRCQCRRGHQRKGVRAGLKISLDSVKLKRSPRFNTMTIFLPQSVVDSAYNMFSDLLKSAFVPLGIDIFPIERNL